MNTDDKAQEQQPISEEQLEEVAGGGYISHDYTCPKCGSTEVFVPIKKIISVKVVKCLGCGHVFS